MNDLNLGVIGNSTFGALINKMGRVVWACFPRFDGDPLFCSLLGNDAEGGPEDRESGFFDIELQNFARSEQHYLHNTAILITTLYDTDGAAVEITDFAPRFKRLERMFRPMMMVRQVRPVIGHPRITIRIRPSYSYGAEWPQRTRGSNHIRYVAPHITLRCTTTAPISYVLNEVPFILEEPFTIMLGADESLTSPLEETSRQFLDSTIDYWREWSRYLAIPFEWQDPVIRSAITLKLCSFEESGAIIAALTTSIPEAAGTERNWDYRFCWLRDAYFVVKALNRLGATRTMEDLLRYITNIVAAADNGHLQPVYGIALDNKLIEEIVPDLPGYRGMGPVRKGNQAYEHIQNDIYGSVILAATQSFFDERLVRPGNVRLFERLEAVGERCLELYDQPDAGLWELRTKAKVHTYSAVMCWAGTDRLARIAEQLGMTTRATYWQQHADSIRAEILEKTFDEKQNTFVESFGGSEVDASLLMLFELDFIEATDPRFVGTVEAIEKKLRRGKYLFRYATEDDFGVPQTAFNICTFWYIDALSALGREEEARDLFENMLSCRNHLGLLSEDLDPETGELWGNFPQTYSMVGFINSAVLLSKNWRDAF
ncbi:MAG: glycoside hydrolase family 15 protein [Rhodospirillales bacterium]|nr:glycoside hydrolase family 15 protein [Rhodospirillales bacterium]